MTAVTRPRGPLPARVYWTRRALLLVLPLALVYAVAHLLAGGGVGGSGGDSSATPVAAESSAVASTGTASSAPSITPSAGPVSPTAPAAGATGGSKTPLPAPSGTCVGSDVVVTPSVKEPAYAGRPIVLVMTLTTTSSPACTWTVAPSSLVVKVTSDDDDRFWSTQDCVGSIPKQSVVVRKDTPVTVRVVWNGQRSDADCTRSTPWAEPGSYHVVAAAYSNPTPGDQQFELLAPPRPTVTASPSLSAKPSSDG